MSSDLGCDESCIMPGCTLPIEYFANYSKFHGVCKLHFLKETITKTIKCSKCNLNIKWFEILPNRAKSCQIIGCNEPVANMNCMYHGRCQNHLNYSSCNEQSCRCAYCNQEIPKTSLGSCTQCLEGYRRCIICNGEGWRMNEVCRHFLCNAHRLGEGFCYCFQCSKCNAWPATKIQEGNYLCEKCIRICVVCNQSGSMKREDCNHYYCEAHYYSEYY
jgi:hypothetical protein